MQFAKICVARFFSFKWEKSNTRLLRARTGKRVQSGRESFGVGMRMCFRIAEVELGVAQVRGRMKC